MRLRRQPEVVAFDPESVKRASDMNRNLVQRLYLEVARLAGVPDPESRVEEVVEQYGRQTPTPAITELVIATLKER